MLLWTQVDRYLFEILFPFFRVCAHKWGCWNTYVVIPYLIFWGTAILFPIVARCYYFEGQTSAQKWLQTRTSLASSLPGGERLAHAPALSGGEALRASSVLTCRCSHLRFWDLLDLKLCPRSELKLICSILSTWQCAFQLEIINLDKLLNYLF